MPAAYAHFQFGCYALAELDEQDKGYCLAHRELFNFGVHGPDIFFYYHPLESNPIAKFGSEMHHHSGREFFTHAAEVIRTSTGEDREKKLAYILGFLAHFALDSSCHGYINTIPKTLGMSHNYAESQYEAYCMEKGGEDPDSFNRKTLVYPSEENAAVIASFFDFSREEVYTALKGQQNTLDLLYSPSGFKRALLKGGIGLLHLKGDFADLFVEGKKDPRCEETNKIIEECEKKAIAVYPELARNLLGFIEGKEEPCSYFDHDFEGN